MKNIVILVEAFFGTVFLVFGVATIGRDDRAGWWYLVVALLCFVLAGEPTRRLRDFVGPRRPDA
jgi:hypothetical protein